MLYYIILYYKYYNYYAPARGALVCVFLVGLQQYCEVCCIAWFVLRLLMPIAVEVLPTYDNISACNVCVVSAYMTYMIM